MRQSNCSDPIPLGTHGDITFFGCPGLLITLYLPCPSLLNHFKRFIFQCQVLHYHAHFSSDPGSARGDGLETIWLAHNYDYEFVHNYKSTAYVGVTQAKPGWCFAERVCMSKEQRYGTYLSKYSPCNSAIPI